MEERSRRIAGLDLMKVLGLYLVVLYHMTFRQAPEVLPHGLRTMALYFPVPLLSICVPLFFLSSGALSLTRPLDLRKTLFRALHLTVLLLIWHAKRPRKPAPLPHQPTRRQPPPIRLW